MLGFIFINIVIKVDHFYTLRATGIYLYYNFSKNKSFTFNIYNFFNKRGYTFKFFVFNIFNKNRERLVFSFSILVKKILYIKKKNVFIYSFFGISLCPYGNVFIPSERI